jgi:hypothetical protein
MSEPAAKSDAPGNYLFVSSPEPLAAAEALSTLVVCDELPAKWVTPLFADDKSLQRRADRLESELPLP